MIRDGGPSILTGNIHSAINGRFGIGANFTAEKFGFDKVIMSNIACSYKYTLKSGSVLAGGIGLGFIQKSITGNPYNIKLSEGTAMDLNAGFYYSMPRLSVFNNFYAGISTSHLNIPGIRMTWDDGTDKYISTVQFSRQHYFVTGADLPLSKALLLNPNILMRIDDRVKSTYDINCVVTWKQRIRVGAGYRTLHDLIILAGYRFGLGRGGSLDIGYSCDLAWRENFDDGPLGGSHQVMLRYRY
jgi:type IX secretion system PorP/SprF family membrane protein